MKLLFLLIFVPACLAVCPANHYKDDVFNKCVKCTPCHVTVIPCSFDKDAVCATFSDEKTKTNHHFQKNRIHFLDDMLDESLEEEYHAKNFLPHHKDHHKKNVKHFKSKHDEKLHHKKKHYEFDHDDDNIDDDSYENYNDEFDFNFEKVEKPKKHKKHYEFNKKHNKKSFDDLSPDEELEGKKLHFILGKESKKTSHPKKIDIDEEELEEWLLQSQKKLKIRKDNLLKTLKDEKVAEKSKNKVHLNSPILDSDDDESFDSLDKLENSKGKKRSDANALKALADLNEDEEDDDDEYDDDWDEDDSFLPGLEESYKPVPSPHKVNKKPSDEVIGQGKKVDEILKAEMGKNVIHEKPRFSVIPFVVGKDFKPEKKSFSHKYHSSSQNKQDTWDDEDEEYREIKTNEVVSLPFTAAETLVWDWQALAVASAVASCLVFFLVVAIYFVVNNRQWKKVKRGYSQEQLDEITTRLALMQPMLEMGSQNSHSSSLYMDSILSPDERKGDMKV